MWQSVCLFSTIQFIILIVIAKFHLELIANKGKAGVLTVHRWVDKLEPEVHECTEDGVAWREEE